jgi:hypothetical protein
MPRGIKGSGKNRKPAGEPGPPRRRGRKPKELIPEAVQPVELPPAEEQLAEMRDEEPRVAGELSAEPPAGEPASEAESAPPLPALTAQPPELAAAESELVRKYPNVAIKPGSLRLGGAEGWGNKHIVTIVCSACKVNERVLATSDLFHVSMCPVCSKSAKKAARKAKKQS